MSARLSVRTATVALSAAGLAVAGAVVVGSPASADSRTVVLRAALSGAAEVPGPGDDDGTGRAQLRIKASTGQICYTIKVAGIAPAAAAHIHEGPATGSGPVVEGLTAPTDGSSSACFVDPELAADLVEDPADYYVNVHNAPFPGGALRGQLG